MSDNKQAALASLNEADFRGKVLVPLLRKMGFSDVMEYHGPLEFGKDIVFWEEDRFGERVYYAVVTKTGKIHGSATKAGGVKVVLYQAEQALAEPWLDPFNLSRHRIDRVVIATSGTITQSATMSIEGRLQNQHIRFLDGNRIRAIVDKYAPEIWQTLGAEELAPPKVPSLSEALENLKQEKAAPEKGRRLEQLVKRLFDAMPGFDDVVANVRSSVEEIDVMFRNESTDAFWNQQGPFVMVECKSWSKKVGRAELDVLAAKMSRRAGWCRLGFFISLSGFTKGFSVSLRQYISSNVLVVPIDEDRLRQLCEAFAPKTLLKQFIFETINL